MSLLRLERRAAQAWRPLAELGVLVLLGAALLFTNYGAGELQRWDEGLYGRFARNALTHHDYLLPLDEAGRYATEPFSKPPLSFLLVALSFQLLGASVTSLRLPFTLAALATATVCWAWGRDMAQRYRWGRALGLAWGIAFLLTQAMMLWGRYAVIEDAFVLFMMLALWQHARSIASPGEGGPVKAEWCRCLLSGICLALAFLIKQLAFGLAVVPMLGVELWHVRRGRLWRSWARVLCWGGPAVVAAAVWAALGYAREGERFASMLWDFALVQRFDGYSGTVHFNILNRVSNELALALQPFSAPIALLGVGLMALSAWRRARERGLRDAGIVAFLLTGMVVFENATKSLLPWYVLSLIPTLTLGVAWLFSEGTRACRALMGGHFRASAQVGALAALAGLSFSLTVDAAAAGVISRININLALLVGLGACVWARSRLSFSAARHLPVGGLALGAAFALGCRFRHSEYHISEGPLEVAMSAVTAARSSRPVVSQAVAKVDPNHYEPVTLFGSAVSVGDAPWAANSSASGADSYVALTAAPSEVEPPRGMRLTRLPGGSVWTGTLDHNPVSEEVLSALLEQGPLTFEAEGLGTGDPKSRRSDGSASGGEARAYVAWLSEGNKDHLVTDGVTVDLPAGKYMAVFWLRWRCGKQRGSRLGYIEVADKKRELDCGQAPVALDYAPVLQAFTLAKPAPVRLRVGFRRSRSELWHDRSELWSIARWEAASSARSP